MTMPVRLIQLFAFAVFAVSTVAACAPRVPDAATGGTGPGGASAGTGGALGSGGATGTGGVTATGGVTVTGGSGGMMPATADGGPRDGGDDGPSIDSGGLTAADCPEMPHPRRMTGAILDVPLEVVFQGKPFKFGEPNARVGGGTVIPLNLRFYISGVALLRADNEEPVAVDIVTADGLPARYGVHLFNAEDPESTTFKVLAPPGTYTGMKFLFGLDGGCNSRVAQGSKAPLSVTSLMSWEHSAGYLFLRYEGRVTEGTPHDGGTVEVDGGAGADVLLPAIHMGGRPMKPLAPIIEVRGALSVPAAGISRIKVRLLMDAVFKGALIEADLTDFFGPPEPEVLAGERLRRSAPGLRLFEFAP